MAHYAEPHSVESIRSAITLALSEPKTTALRDHIKREFLWSTVAQKTAEVYKRILSQRSNLA
jgi:glycosyltransferase involved in cell wall biosynthesis